MYLEKSPLLMPFTFHSFGKSLSPVYLRRKSARSVSYYTLFQGWLLLGKPPSCLYTPTPFITKRSFRGLSWWFGLFPFRRWSLSPSSHWSTLTPVILRSYLVFRVCLDLVPLSRHAPKQCFTPRCPVNCYTSTHFGENQLTLGSSSPLTTTHPLILHHQSIRTSI